MKSNLVAQYIFIGVILSFYLVYTIIYALDLMKNPFFKGRTKIFHMIMIWLVPFIWIMFLKSFFKATPGSHYFKKKKDPGHFTESGIGTHGDGGHQ